MVRLDNLGGARSAVEHLLAHGHERIAMVADRGDLYTAAERLHGRRRCSPATTGTPWGRCTRRVVVPTELVIRGSGEVPPP